MYVFRIRFSLFSARGCFCINGCDIPLILLSVLGPLWFMYHSPESQNSRRRQASDLLLPSRRLCVFLSYIYLICLICRICASYICPHIRLFEFLRVLPYVRLACMHALPIHPYITQLKRHIESSLTTQSSDLGRPIPPFQLDLPFTYHCSRIILTPERGSQPGSGASLDDPTSRSDRFLY